jgi:hypothetical protein
LLSQLSLPLFLGLIVLLKSLLYDLRGFSAKHGNLGTFFGTLCRLSNLRFSRLGRLGPRLGFLGSGFSLDPLLGSTYSGLAL